MKKKNKNLLTLALATLVVGAGVDAVATVNSAPVSQAVIVKAADAYVNDVTDYISVSKVSMNASYRSRYDVVINFDNVAFNAATFYTNQYPEQLGVKLGDYIVINGKTITEICAPYSTGTQAEQKEARKVWLDDLDDGTNDNTSNEDWGFNKGWVPVVGQVNTNNVTLMIDRRLAAPTDLELTIKGGLEIPYTDADGDAVLKVSKDVTFKFIPDASNVENLKGVLASTEELETTVTATAADFKRVGETEKNIQYQLHTDLALFSSYNACWLADHYMYLNDYFTVNGKTFSQWNKETYLAEYTTGAINSTAYQYSTPLVAFLHAKSEVVNGSGTVFQFYISKAWMTAMGIDESSMVLGIREGLTFVNPDGKVAKSSNALSYAKLYSATVSVNGENKTVQYTAANKADKLAEIAAMLPANTAEYTYAWAEALPTELPLEDGKTYTVAKTPVEYTITFAGVEGVEAITFTVENKDTLVLPAVPEKTGYSGAWDKAVVDLSLENTTVTAVYTAIEYTATVAVNGEDKTVVYTIENKAEKLAEIVAMLPANTAEYTYTWAEALPTELPLENGKTYVVAKTAVEYTATLDYLEGDDSTITYTVENRAEKLAEIKNIVSSKSGADYKYTWTGLPEELPLENGKTYVETKTAAEYEIVFKVDGEQYGETVTFTADTKAELVFPTIPAKDGYMAAWDKAVVDLSLENATVTAVYTAIEYTATVVVDGTETTVTYTVENKAEKLAEIAAMLPANTAEYTYAWAETLPAELPLENGKTYTVIKTAVVVTPPTSEEPDNSEEPTTSEQPTTSEPSSSESGCFGSVGGLSAGVLALGAAVMLLKKKKEDK